MPSPEGFIEASRFDTKSATLMRPEVLVPQEFFELVRETITQARADSDREPTPFGSGDDGPGEPHWLIDAFFPDADPEDILNDIWIIAGAVIAVLGATALLWLGIIPAA